MKNWSKRLEIFKNLSIFDKILFFKVFLCIIFIKITLNTLPFNYFIKLYKKISYSPQKDNYSTEYIEKIVWFVKALSYHLPFSVVCLPQALVVKFFLRKDKDIYLKIGVNNENKQFQAHAWLEKNKQFIIGDTPLITYIPIWEWN
jgi:hypothetical protein